MQWPMLLVLIWGLTLYLVECQSIAAPKTYTNPVLTETGADP